MIHYIRSQYRCGILLRLLIVLPLVFIGSYYFTPSKTWSKIGICTLSNQLLCGKQIPFLQKSDAQCTKYNFTSVDPNITHTSLPIYDFFLFNHEFDTLEIRLHELYNYVTLFLIAESRETLTGKEKPLYLKENWSKFAKYHDKIRRIEVRLNRNVTDAWPNEHRMRNEGLKLALSTITDKKYLLLTSDVDEIPKARFMNALANCPLPDPFPSSVLDCDFYYYSYEFRSKSYVLYGPAVNLVISNQTKLPSGNDIRNERFRYKFMSSTCYHCTWCFNQLEQVRTKISSYSHTEHNQMQFRTREHILDRYRYGKDLFDRPNDQYVYIKNNTDFPQLVKLQPERFIYMWNRSKLPNVGFIDV